MIRYAVTICVLHGHRGSTIIRIKRIVDAVTVCVGACRGNVCKTIAIGIVTFERIVDAVTIRVKIKIIRDTITIGITYILIGIKNAVVVAVQIQKIRDTVTVSISTAFVQYAITIRIRITFAEGVSRKSCGIIFIYVKVMHKGFTIRRHCERHRG